MKDTQWKGKILLVDDQPASIGMVRRALEAEGYEVIVAQSGEKALERAALTEPDLILLDILMSGMDGYETCKQLKAQKKTTAIPVIFLSGLTETFNKVTGFKLGAVDYVAKPIEPEELLARVKTHLTIHWLQQELREINRTLEDKVLARTQELSGANDALRKANRAYRSLSECNQALLRATEEHELLQDVCQIIREECGYHLVWIGFAEHDEAKTVRPVAQAGYEQGYLDTANLTWEDTERGRGPTGTAIRKRQPVINRDILTNPDYAPWRDEAMKRGYASSAAFPLCTDKQDIIGALNVYAAQPDAFVPEEIDLLMEIANDLAYGIMSLRARAERNRAEEKLKGALTEIEQLKDRLQAENLYFQEEIKSEYNFDKIVGQSNLLKYLLFKVEKVAPTDTIILISGETGTGKELIARAIHSMSPRKDRPLVKVSCATLPAHLIESELFGHEKGAFTGAYTKRIGRFELADGATIFLDEIGELPLELQAKLLRVLEEGEFERLGSSRTIKVDVHVIAATNRDLREEVQAGRFRQDLFYRLSVYPLSVPPLRERRDDIPLLVWSFVQKFNKKLGKQIKSIPQETLHALQQCVWPGNIRELENVIERAVITTQGDVLRVELPETPALKESDTNKTLEEIEREYILQVLKSKNWRIEGAKGAALILGLHPNTLRYRMQKLGIKRP